MNFLYTAAKAEMLKGQFNALSQAFKMALIDADDYTALASHASLSDIPAAAIISTAPVVGVSVGLDGGFSCGNIVFNSVTGDELEAVIIYKDTGVASTSTLLAYLDTGSGFPLLPNGSDVVVNFNGNPVFTL